jgi:hypothetical protein
VSVVTKKMPDGFALRAMSLALTAAQNMSERAGLGWCLVDEHENLLAHGNAMHGIETQRLAFSVAHHRYSLAHLFITCEPLGKLFECGPLIQQIEKSTCSQISIALKADENLVDPEWLEWVKTWNGKVNYNATSGIAQNLLAGATSIKHNKRPWVIAICASNINNQSIPLAHLSQEFGFLPYVINLTGQSRAFIYDTTQRDILDKVPTENNIDETIDFFETNGSKNVISVLQHCASGKKCSVVIASDLKQLSELIYLDLVDEVVYHIMLTSPPIAPDLPASNGLDFGAWHLLSTDTVGNSARMHLKKDKAQTLFYSLSDLRLN